MNAGTLEEWLAARVELLEREKERNAPQRRASPGSARSCRGCGSKRSTPSRRTRGRRRSPSPSTAAPSSSSTTSCSGPSRRLAGGRLSGLLGTADTLDGAVVHLPPRGVTFVAVSKAPLERLNAYKEAHGVGVPTGVHGEGDQPRPRGFHRGGAAHRQGLQFRYAKHSDIDLRDQEPPRSECVRPRGRRRGPLDPTYGRCPDALNATWQPLDRTPKRPRRRTRRLAAATR